MRDRLVAARLVGTFGVRGELKCVPTRVGEPAIVEGRGFVLGRDEGARRVSVTSVRRHKGRILVAFQGVESIEAAQALVGSELYIERDAIELAEDEYLDADLIGMRLIDEAGKDLGAVTGVEHYPAQDCLVVGRSHALVPLVREFVRSVDLDARAIHVSLPPGLLDPATAHEA
jgi:16S rRNA processing protein RimM